MIGCSKLFDIAEGSVVYECPKGVMVTNCRGDNQSRLEALHQKLSDSGIFRSTSGHPWVLQVLS